MPGLRIVFVTTLLACAALLMAIGLCAAGEVGAKEKPRLVKVIFEREIDPETLNKYELGGGNRYFDKALTDEEIQQWTDYAKKSTTIIKMALYLDPADGKYFLKTIVLAKDKAKEAEEVKWKEYARKELAVGKNFGGFTYEHHLARLGAGYLFVGADTLQEVYSGPHGEYVNAHVAVARKESISAHEFLRRLIQEDCRVEKTSIGYVVMSKDKWAKTSERGRGLTVAWLSGERIAVDIMGFGIKPDGLIPLYGAKFPSSLPKDFEIDKIAWGREEMEFWLAKMKKAVEATPEKEAQNQLSSCVYRAGGYAYFPLLEGATKNEAPLDLLKKQYELMDKWWTDNKNKTYWHEQEQKLVAKGQSPEELAAAEKKRKEDELKARLDAPITDEKMKELRAKLIEVFEKVQAARADSHNKHKGVTGITWTFTKDGEGHWVLTSQPKSGEPTIWTYTDVVISKRGRWSKARKEYPLQGAFKCRCHDGLSKTDSNVEEVFYYERLKDRWTQSIDEGLR